MNNRGRSSLAIQDLLVVVERFIEISDRLRNSDVVVAGSVNGDVKVDEWSVVRFLHANNDLRKAVAEAKEFLS